MHNYENTFVNYRYNTFCEFKKPVKTASGSVFTGFFVVHRK